jgi:hypothetical protein
MSKTPRKISRFLKGRCRNSKYRKTSRKYMRPKEVKNLLP